MLLSELSERDFDERCPTCPAITEHTISCASGCAPSSTAYAGRATPLAVDELEVGLTAAAAPIRSAHGDIIASMSISGPTFRLTGQRLEQTVPMLVAAALEVSHRLGWGRRT